MATPHLDRIDEINRKEKARLRAEIERLRTTAHVPAVWDGMITIETEVFMNGIRYSPGTYVASLQRATEQDADTPF